MSAQPPGTNPNELAEAIRRDQLKLVYDYIKFHIGLYLSTPAVIGIIGKALNVDNEPIFRLGMLAMIAIFLVVGIHAAGFVGRHVLERWDHGSLARFDAEAYTKKRIALHHVMYFVGLFTGVIGVAVSVVLK